MSDQPTGVGASPDAERDAAIAQRVRDQAHDAAERAAAAASDVEEDLGDVIAEARDLREKITGGAVAPDDARRALAQLRRRHEAIAAHVPSLKIVYERAVNTVEDPSARVAELTSKFGSLLR
jgi:hypothetical protein